MNILTIGGGSWGTALTYLLDNKGHKCFLWEYNEDYRKQIREKRENENFLKGFKLSESIEIIDDFNLVLENEDIDIILLATPTQFLRDTLNKLKDGMKKKYILVNVAKGIEISTGLTISKICEEILKDKEYEYVLLAGPTHAEEVVNNMPSVILSVSKNTQSAKIVQETFNNKSLRVYTGNDVIGSELGGAIKNCLAICAGICDGLGYGDNTKAALLTRGMNEIILIGSTLGANPLTFMGLTGLGDMIVTCTSKHSRNRYLGEQIGKGRKLEDIVSEMKMVSEGASTIKALYQIIKKNEIRTPIFTALYELLYENKDVSTLTQTFMERELRSEF
ncbi:NAD(P)H-dependent glycerol-3-phosphate dehydrogenase [Streptobacillus moniliformis]|uniref:Glycerol-3-phosphate dehydrogenase [NAD(P)+] n=1 Tax=Streptobacillus moniliformis (strain ATCC 14647 / DSM 12112 / NCTC 10651 / 9901) TaxID=519441 RepID=D1AXM8_STRM9|nr:NAD(P)H-dependent glycerol-3-phosphate dehydrogenase [Streptobacillus moniliformis]ACZ01054.1 Glycerol-3-phosphate dehydrogenase (NAD(P)(+)) [Streptobacillus moniliformis DSM 12112]AVL42576.1 glycerol-3-phosphate dehydrogenase [Streptobacillus moniliformis]QXW65832.1 NAD(P)-dependent glycerol-3-phosphate dehydrogenase [Streptobacillus moniliformis]SQA13804.1 Glycerol-3-phosphate dehydrogenase [NAD(P)+] [Streptobacillus moniliformis]